MSQRETSVVDIEWLTGVLGAQAHILMDGNTGTITIDGVSVLVNGSPVSGLTYLGVWAVGTTYGIGALVTGSDGDLYVGIVAGNVGNDPISSPTKWTKVVNVPVFVDGVFTASAAGTVPLTAQGFAGQTADLFEVTDSIGNPLGGFDAAGNLILAPNIVAALGSVILVAGAVPAVFTNGRQLLAGANMSLDATVAGQLTINTSAGGGGIAGPAGTAIGATDVTLITGPTLDAGAFYLIRATVPITIVGTGTMTLKFRATGGDTGESAIAEISCLLQGAPSAVLKPDIVSVPDAYSEFSNTIIQPNEAFVTFDAIVKGNAAPLIFQGRANTGGLANVNSVPGMTVTKLV